MTEYSEAAQQLSETLIRNDVKNMQREALLATKGTEVETVPVYEWNPETSGFESYMELRDKVQKGAIEDAAAAGSLYGSALERTQERLEESGGNSDYRSQIRTPEGTETKKNADIRSEVSRAIVMAEGPLELMERNTPPEDVLASATRGEKVSKERENKVARMLE